MCRWIRCEWDHVSSTSGKLVDGHLCPGLLEVRRFWAGVSSRYCGQLDSHMGPRHWTTPSRCWPSLRQGKSISTRQCGCGNAFVRVCLSFSCSNFSLLARKLHFCDLGTSSQCLAHFRMSRSSCQGEGHRSKKAGYTSETKYTRLRLVRLRLKGNLVMMRVTYCTRGDFEGERVGTAFPLLKCLRTHRNAMLL